MRIEWEMERRWAEGRVRQPHEVDQYAPDSKGWQPGEDLETWPSRQIETWQLV